MKKVLVAGATGYLGQFVVKELKKQGYFVRALSRSASRIEALRADIDEIAVGQVTEPDSLDGVCSEIDAVISTVGITRQKDGLTYMDVDYQGNKNLLDAAKNAGVRKFIYVSAFGVDDMKDVKVAAAKQMFARQLQASGIPYTVLYPNGFFSDMLEVLDMAKKGKAYVFGDGSFKLNPIHGADLAEVCVQAIDSNETRIEIGGPDIFTQTDLYETAFSALGKPARIKPVPIWIGNAFLGILKLFTSVKTYGPIEFFLSSLTRDMVAPVHGKHHLAEYYKEQVNAILGVGEAA